MFKFILQTIKCEVVEVFELLQRVEKKNDYVWIDIQVQKKKG